MKKNTNWNFLDRLIANVRYKKVQRHIPNNGTVVDMGCGQKGDFLLKCKNKINKGYGFDLKIKNSEIDNIMFVNNSKLKRMPLENESIDAVFLNAVLEHLHNPRKHLKDCLRVLKPQGVIIITTPTPFSKSLLEFMAFKLHIINEEEIKSHIHYYNKNDIEKLIKKVSDNMLLVKYQKFEMGLNSLIIIEKSA